MYLRSTAALSRLCDQAKAEGLISLDVEFIREYTFKPQLALIQMAVSDTCVIVDPLAVDDLSPLSTLVSSHDSTSNRERYNLRHFPLRPLPTILKG